MAQPERELDPYSSMWAFVGHEMRALRKVRGWSVAALGERVHVSGALIAKIERAQRRPQPETLTLIDRALVANGALVRLGQFAAHHERFRHGDDARVDREGELAEAVRRLCDLLDAGTKGGTALRTALGDLATAYLRLSGARKMVGLSQAFTAQPYPLPGPGSVLSAGAGHAGADQVHH